MPLKKVLADLGRGVWSPSGGKKNHQKSSAFFYQGTESSLSRHIYYEPPDEFDWSAESALIPCSTSPAGEIVVHRKENTIPPDTGSKTEGTDDPPLDQDSVAEDSGRAYTEEEFTSAILSRTQPGSNAAEHERKTLPSEITSQEINTDFSHLLRSHCVSDTDSADAGIPLRKNLNSSGMCDRSTTNDSGVVKQGEAKEIECGQKCKNKGDLKPPSDSRRNDRSVSPLPERRNKSVLGRLKSFASRTSYSTSEDGHSHSSDYEEQDEEKKVDLRFQREAKERSSASWVRHLRRDVKKRISRLKNSRISANSDEGQEGTDNHIQTGSSIESIPSGSGSSHQPPTPTSSNRSSTSAGEEDNAAYMGAFMGRARALVDYTPSPYDKDGLAFKKGDIIDIIAKHKTGIWVGMAQGKVGHFKFINVEEIMEECKPRRKRHRAPANYLSTVNKPETLEQLLTQLGLQEYMNVLVLNGYDELETFKEIEKEDLESLGIISPEHRLKLLRAAEMLHGIDFDVEEDVEEEEHLIQSPRDSGCYASHENLTQKDPVQPNLQTSGHIEDEVDTSHSESGVHSREGPDLSLAMNNLDLSAESSTKSVATAFDEKEDNAITTDHNEYPENFSSYNILPSQTINEEVNIEEDNSNEMRIVEPVESEQFVPVTTFANSISSSMDPESQPAVNTSSTNTETNVSVPNGLKVSLKDSPKHLKNSRNKHSNNARKSKHDGIRQLHSVLKNNEKMELAVDRNPYISGWSSFGKKEKRSRRRQEYDDVVSDPALDPEESPIRHVYRRAKHRKGSLQELVCNPKPPSATLMGLVKQKLERESIFLFDEPYTDKTGFCGIPPALVQRYAEELQQNLPDVANALDQVRITLLQQQARRGVPNDFLADSCTVPVIEANYSCIHSWLVSLGLPMYEANLTAWGCRTLDEVSELSYVDLDNLGIPDSRHQMFLEVAIGTLRSRFGVRTP